MQLFYTPRSHYSRKVRILIQALGLDCELKDVGNVALPSDDLFGPNPLMKVPTLIDDDTVIFDSDHIAQYLVQKYDQDDHFKVLTKDTQALNARAIMNGVMAADVELVLAARAGEDTSKSQRLQKLARTIEQSLDWLETHQSIFTSPPSYLEFHLVCMWDHLAFYHLLPGHYQGIAAKVKHFSELPYIQATAPC